MADETTTAAPKTAGKTKQVRLLEARGDNLANHVITVPANTDVSGWGDDTPEAVAYALENEPQPQPDAE